MGGQFDYFGLWINQEFGEGHSRARPKCTTYDSPQLSSKEDFTIETVEVWAVGPLPKKPQVRWGFGVFVCWFICGLFVCWLVGWLVSVLGAFCLSSGLYYKYG